MIEAADVRARLDAVVAAMKQEGVWDVSRPPHEAFTDMGAFGIYTMAFAQWLRFVFVPNVTELIQAGGPWPEHSQVAVQAAREGDTNAAIAALVPALSSFDDLFDVDESDERVTENLAGWRLMSRPDRTNADLEAAVAHFRRSNEGAALTNLADALLALGRPAEALAAMEAAPTRPEAHNWLGWYYTAKASDLPRAVAHLEQALELRPGWGVAWLNLAKARDAAGDALAACRAFGEAIACGDAHDDAYARDRRVQLELALRTHGETPPEPPATARSDSAAVRLVLAAAAFPELATGHTFMIRPTARAAAGQRTFAGVATVFGDRALGHAVIEDEGHRRVASVLVHADPVALQSVAADDPREAARLLRDWIAGGGADATGLTPLDAAVYLLDLLGRDAPRAWGLAVEAERPATLGVAAADGSATVRVRARPGGSVFVGLPDGTEIEIDVPARLLAVAPRIVEAVRSA